MEKNSFSIIIEKIKPLVNLKFVNYYALILNLFCVLTGILYSLIPYNILFLDIFWNSFGVILIITFFGNIIYNYIISKNLNKTSIKGRRFNLFCKIYFLFIISSISMMLIGNLLFGMAFEQGTLNFGYWALIFVGYFGNLGIGACLSILSIKNYKNRDLWISKEETASKYMKSSLFGKILKGFLILFCLVMLGFGGYMTYVIIFSPYSDFIAWLIGIFILPFALYFSFMMVISTVIILKSINRKKRPILFYSMGILGLFFTTIFLLPLMSTPFVYQQAEQSFSSAFGGDWEASIDSNANSYFLKTPFSLPAYFIGMEQKECIIDADNLFYDNESVTLYYDAYYVNGDRSFLPGNSSVIISIHGGGWTGGSKGQGNLRFINSYFAAQGYVVFDIEYGLINEANLFQMIGAPAHVIGNFSIEDQLRHIGYFIKLLNTTEFSSYNLNLDSIFITGGSAGGHLTVASTLLINNGSYSEWFGSDIQIKGMIPLYPGDPPSRYGSDEVLNPEKYYIDANSSPCLILQGERDFCLLKTQKIKESYSDASNNDCSVIHFPFQGHANDIYHTGHFNQFLLYYAERFLYLCTHNKIA
ncbi:MAG: hypothetical protein EU541_04900 [Promethearchaeota archaeon]|nr:MAG: hypothetical protein EU541_04900 [Candidatus Lokiarchaeota archaeon]